MATNDVLYRRGTGFTLASGNASGIFTINCTSGVSIQSNKFDLGDPHADEYEMYVEITTSGAPTIGSTCDFYLAESIDNTNFTGKASGSDGLYMTASTKESFLMQTKWLGSLSVYDSGNETQRQSFVIRPVTQYGSLILSNNTIVSLQPSGSKITLTPLIPQIQS
jgi:hypothetical protein